MYLKKIYDPEAFNYRVRYAIATILRDRFVNEGAFKCCFEMGDEEEVMRNILLRALKNPKLLAALQRSHLVNIAQWLPRFPDLAEAYYAISAIDIECERTIELNDQLRSDVTGCSVDGPSSDDIRM